MIQLIVDSTCDLPPGWRQAHHIPVLPLIVNLEGKEYRDGEEITIRDLFGPMQQGIVPKTSQVPAIDMYNQFSTCCKDGKDFIFLCISDPLSGTYGTALTIKDTLQKDYPHIRMAVLDSRSASMATGLLAMQTYYYIRNGLAFEEVVRRLEDMITHVRHLFTLESLDWLVKGGRLPKPIGLVGDVFQLKPILEFKNGLVSLSNMSRGRKKTLSAIISRLTEEAADFPEQLIAVAHSNDLPAALEMAKLIKTNFPGCKTVISEIGCVLGVHLGIGGVGAFWFTEAPPDYCLLDEQII